MDANAVRPWWRCVVESAILLSILTLGGWVVGAQPGFRGVFPNPYVIVVCLMALRYGLRDALLSAGQAFGWLLAIEGAQLLIQTAHTVAPQLLLWDALVLVGAGLLLGQLADEHLSREAKLRSQVSQLDPELREVRGQVHVLEEANRELVKRVTGETQTIGRLYGIAEKLSALDLKDLYPGILDLVAEYVGAEKCTLYLIQGDRLVAAEHRGWERPAADRPTIPLENGVMARVVRDRQTLSLRDLAIEGTPPPDQWSMSTPLIEPETGRPIGALVAEQLPFQRLNRSNVRVFSVIGRWAGMAIREAATYSTAVTGKAQADAAMNRLVEELKTRSSSRHAIPALVEMGEPVIPLLAEVLRTGTPRQRFHTLEALDRLRAAGYTIPPEAMQGLIAHEFPRLTRLLRFSAALVDVKSPAFEALRWTLEEEQALAVDSLLLANAMRAGVPITLTTRQWRSQNPELRNRAVSEIRAMHPSPVIQVVLRLCEGGPAAALAVPAVAAQPLPRPEAIPAIILGEDKDLWLVAGALHAAPACADPHMVDLVLPWTEDMDPLVRENAFAALAGLVRSTGVEGVIARLTGGLNDPSLAIRALVASLLVAVSARSHEPTLIVTFLNGPFQGQQRQFERFPVVFGRAPGSDLVLVHDNLVSRMHVRVSQEVRGFVVEDMHSTNGTFLDRVRLTAPLPLISAKVIQIGRTLLHLAPATPTSSLTG